MSPAVRSVLEWLRNPLPNTDDPEIRRRVVFATIGLAFAMFLMNIAVVSWNLVLREKLYNGIAFQRNLCHSQQSGRRQANIRNARIRHYLVHVAAAPRIAAAITDSKPLDCKTGVEIPPKKETKR